ncbi:ZIP family metal transporter [Inquilinus sp. Marseille-Q2685]|uniref:ZIP family metal transporter n=1 Tax=Inquilinus sp. Marseille-Q2685 TaxID=2866581 RepID=UPI001CE4B021|nr:metal transporter [Inquilinus sp. Marseille-Q2685]
MTRAVAWTLLPLLLIVAVAAAFLTFDPLRSFSSGAPPIEQVTVERTTLDSAGISLLVRGGGSAPVEIAQIQVDGAYWTFTQDPPGPIDRLSTAWLRLPYPWVVGETHHLTLVTRTGVVFDHTIDVAVATPQPSVAMLRNFGLVGLFVGVVPIALGMLFYPALRTGGASGFTFALALTIGLLAFLLVDTMGEAVELAGRTAPELHAPVLVWLVAGVAFAVLMTIGRRKGHPLSGVALAASIALGIGLHNLGEGLAIGSAFATGAAALGSFLVLGFTLHNITEGIGIVAPLLDRRPGWPVFAGLAALAGLPAVFGIWFGSYAYSPHWAALALAVGAGAILQVIVEVGLLIMRQGMGAGRASGTAVAGIAAGIAVMYGTALLVQT